MVTIVIYDTMLPSGAGYMIYAVPSSIYYPGMPESEVKQYSLGEPQPLAPLLDVEDEWPQ